MNYFEFYGLPITFRVDEPALRQIYYRNSKKYHPDFHTLSDETQQTEMLHWSTLNNEAFQTLSDPDRRMRYILELNGLLQEGNTPELPKAFLMDMMDINEALMELEFDFDPARFSSALETLRTMENALDQEVKPILDHYSADSGTPRDLQAVLEYFLKKRYLLRIQENLSKFAPRAGMAEW